MRKDLQIVSEQSVPWRERLFLPLQLASDITGVSIASLYRFESEKRLSFRRLAGRTLVETRSLVALIEAAEPWKPSTLTNRALAARTGHGAQAVQR